MEDMVIPDVMNDEVFSPQRRDPENFLLISQCQEGEVKNGFTWRTLRVPDRRYGGHGHSFYHENFVLIS